MCRHDFSERSGSMVIVMWPSDPWPKCVNPVAPECPPPLVLSMLRYSVTNDPKGPGTLCPPPTFKTPDELFCPSLSVEVSFGLFSWSVSSSKPVASAFTQLRRGGLPAT